MRGSCAWGGTCTDGPEESGVPRGARTRRVECSQDAVLTTTGRTALHLQPPPRPRSGRVQTRPRPARLSLLTVGQHPHRPANTLPSAPARGLAAPAVRGWKAASQSGYSPAVCDSLCPLRGRSPSRTPCRPRGRTSGPIVPVPGVVSPPLRPPLPPHLLAGRCREADPGVETPGLSARGSGGC